MLEFWEKELVGEEVGVEVDWRFIWSVFAVLIVRVWISWRLEEEGSGSSDRVKSREGALGAVWVVEFFALVPKFLYLELIWFLKMDASDGGSEQGLGFSGVVVSGLGSGLLWTGVVDWSMLFSS